LYSYSSFWRWNSSRGKILLPSGNTLEGVFMIIIRQPNFKHPPEDTAFQEMAYPLDKVLDKLLAKEDVVFDHLLKLFYFRDFSDYFNNWTSSVAKMDRVYKVNKGKGKDCYPDAQIILDWLWNKRTDCFESHHDGMIKNFNYKSNPEYSKLPYIHSGGDAESAAKFMGDYYLWLAKKLSQNGRITVAEVQEEIKRLFRKYPY
jgi:hypothetical protein